MFITSDCHYIRIEIIFFRIVLFAEDTHLFLGRMWCKYARVCLMNFTWEKHYTQLDTVSVLQIDIVRMQS